MGLCTVFARYVIEWTDRHAVIAILCSLRQCKHICIARNAVTSELVTMQCANEQRIENQREEKCLSVDLKT